VQTEQPTDKGCDMMVVAPLTASKMEGRVRIRNELSGEWGPITVIQICMFERKVPLFAHGPINLTNCCIKDTEMSTKSCH